MNSYSSGHAVGAFDNSPYINGHYTPQLPIKFSTVLRQQIPTNNCILALGDYGVGSIQLSLNNQLLPVGW